MQITVEIKNRYGVDRIYPVCDRAKIYIGFTGNITLSQSDIDRIKALGDTVEVKTPEL